MPDDVIKRLLIKLGIDGADAVRFISSLQDQLDSLYQSSKQQSAERKNAQTDDLAAMAKQQDMAKQQIALNQQAVSTLRAQIDAKQLTVKQIQEEISKERAALDIRQATLRIMASQGDMSADVIKSLERQITLERQKLTLQQAQLRATGASAGAQRETGIAGGALAAGARGLFGGGLLGSVAGGVLGGIGAVEGIQVLAEGVKELGKSLLEASGPAQNLRREFEKLATNKGADPAALLQKMREATHGLITDTQLFQTANVFLRSNMKLTTDQMLKMVKTTVDLATLSGHTAPEAMNALTLAFERGQPFVLARITGLTTLQRQLNNLPRGIDPAIAATIRMNTVLAALTEAANRGVKPLTTVPDVMAQVTVAAKDFIDGVAQGIVSTGQFGHTLQEISDNLVKALPRIIEFGEQVGKKLAAAVSWLWEKREDIEIAIGLLTLSKVGYSAVTGVSNLIESWKTVTQTIKDAAAAVGLYKAAEAGATATTVAGGVTGVAARAAGGSAVSAILPIVTAVLVALGLEWMLQREEQGEYKQGAQRVVTGYSRGVPIYGPGYSPQQAAAQDQLARNFPPGSGTRKPLGENDLYSGWDTTPDKNKPYVDIQSQKRLEVEMENIRREQARVELQIAKDEIEAEQALLKSKYEQGLIELADYLTKENALQRESRDKRAEEIRIEGETQKAAARVKIQPTITPEGQSVPVSNEAIKAEAAQEALIDEQTKLKLLENDANYRKEVVANDEKLAADRQAAAKTYQQEIIKIKTQGLAEQTALLEKQFKQGNVSPDDYINKRRSLIEEESKLVQDELAQEAVDTAKSEDEKAKIRIKGIEEALAAQKKLTDLETQEDQIRAQALENSYARIRTGYQAQQAAAQLGVQQRTPGARGDETAVLQKLVEENKKYIQELTDEASHLHDQPELWSQVVDKIKQATEEQIKLNQQLAAAKDFAKPLAQLLGTLGTAFGEVRGGSQIAAVIGSVQRSFEGLSQFLSTPGSTGLFGRKKPKKPTTAAAVQTPENKAAAATDQYTQTVKDDVAQLKAAYSQESTQRQAAAKKLAEDLSSIADTYKSANLTAAEGVKALGDAAVYAAGAVRRTGPESAPSATVTASAPQVPTITSEVPNQIPTPSTPSTQSNSSLGTAPTTGGTGSTGGSSSSGSGSDIVSQWTAVLSKSKGALQTFVSSITNAVSSVGNFIGALSHAQSGAGGALSGGAAGASAGSQIGSLIPLPFAGAIGAGIGAIGGAITGGILGSKEAEVQHDVKLIDAQLQNIIDQLNNGTVTISQAIANLREERQQAISLLSGGKGSKGKKGQASQLQQVLQAIDQQIQQLVNEQQQLIDQMDQSILTLSQGIYWQPILTQLDQIVKQYQQFASAAQGNTAQVAAANEYLTQSLQNYSQTMQQTFLADQEQAIQNAQTLLQLEQQQAEMTNQYQSQVYGILSQGVTSRQLSGAQQKGAELEALNQQYSQQQLLLQQEISVANYKYQIQQKIFGLASTQVGLEMEMVAVQDQQADQSLQSVEALQQAINAINAALSSGNLPSLLTSPLSTGGQGLAGILQLLGINVPNVPGLGAQGGINYLSEITGQGAQYQGLIQYANQIDPNFLLDVIQAMITNPGSAARQAVVALLNNPQYGLSTELAASVYDSQLQGFEQWITSGSALPANTPLPPSQPGGYQEGTTYVPQTGIAQLEQGEAVIPAALNPFGASGEFDDASGGIPFQSVAGQTGSALSDANYQVEQQIYQLVMTRVTAEWQLVQAKLQLLQQEQANQTAGGGVASFEGGMQKVYELRGRYGSGAVRTEYL